MRLTTSVPAERLGSVASRYRALTTARPGCVAPRRIWWPDRAITPALGVGEGGPGIERRQRLEAILLIAREPMNSRKLAEHAGLADGTEARTLVRQLNRLYDELGRAFRVEQVGGGFRLLTRRAFAPWLRRLGHVPPVERLSAPAMETLAVVAYRQPVLRAEIEAIRGVSCGEILRQLLDRDLVRIGGRSDELGRPYLYTTTKRFLQLFGLQSLDELPRAFALRNDPRSPDQADGVVTAPMSTDDQQQEQEKSEVSLTLPTRQPVAQWFKEVTSPTLVEPREGYDEEEFEEDFDEEENENEEDEEEEDEAEEDDFDEDELDEDELDEEEEEEEEDEDEDDFEDEEWEEVEDDEEELDEGWDDEDEEWDEDDEDFEEDEESDEEEFDEEEDEDATDEEDEEWE